MKKKRIVIVVIAILLALVLLYDFYPPMQDYALPFIYPFNNPAWLFETAIVSLLAFTLIKKKEYAIYISFIFFAMSFALLIHFNRANITSEYSTAYFLLFFLVLALLAFVGTYFFEIGKFKKKK